MRSIEGYEPIEPEADKPWRFSDECWEKYEADDDQCLSNVLFWQLALTNALCDECSAVRRKLPRLGTGTEQTN